MDNQAGGVDLGLVVRTRFHGESVVVSGQSLLSRIDYVYRLVYRKHNNGCIWR